ncbi:hypothetical protein [Streptomyces sp. NPDC018833]|uniref:hypothetical protein n=1 Tax=Streptomyces sp. NPDC018833 TaxID=3365053 RepID=UPI0037AE55A1
MRMNRAMAEVLANVDTKDLTDADIPPMFLAISNEGWTTTPSGAYVLAALAASGPGGTYADLVHEEVTLNGRGMVDHDLPPKGRERVEPLVRRCLAYARRCLAGAEEVPVDPMLTAYVSVSESWTEERTVTAYVTFCRTHPGVSPYVTDPEDYRHEALLELVAAAHAGETSIQVNRG